MKIGVPKERRPGERRVAASPDTVKRLVGQGVEVMVETGAGAGSRIADQSFADAGAKLADDVADLYRQADVVLKVRRPLVEGEGDLDEMALLRQGQVLIGMLNPYQNRDQVDGLRQGRGESPSRSSSCRGRRARRRWTCSPARPTSLAIAR